MNDFFGVIKYVEKSDHFEKKTHSAVRVYYAIVNFTFTVTFFSPNIDNIYCCAAYEYKCGRFWNLPIY